MEATQTTPQEEQNETVEETFVAAEKLTARREQLRAAQNLLRGTLGGLMAAILGALAWASINVVTGYQVGYMALGVGYLVGIGMRRMGKGMDPVFGYVGCHPGACGLPTRQLA